MFYLFDGVKGHFQQYFSYIVEVSFVIYKTLLGEVNIEHHEPDTNSGELRCSSRVNMCPAPLVTLLMYSR
jgi:hypothetical protein